MNSTAIALYVCFALYVAMDLLLRRGLPDLGRFTRARETTMPVSQDIQDFCSGLSARIEAAKALAVSDALTSAAADAKAAQDAAVAAALAEVQQDHADEVAALKAALDAATPPARP